MTTSKLNTADGTELHLYHWSVNEPKAHLLISHGYAEYGQRYHDFASHLNKVGISVSAFDHRGHGHSQGVRAYVSRFNEFVSDLKDVIDNLHVTVPLFLMGHSLGGLIAVNYCLQYDSERLAGLISSSSALEIDPELSPVLQKLAPILGFLFPKLATEKLDKTYLTRSPENLEAYMNDPLIYLGGTRARTGAEMLKSIRNTRTMFTKIDCPLLVLHGDADRLTMPGGSQKLYDEAKSIDKTLHLFPGLYHELLHEPEKSEVIDKIQTWLLDHIGPSPE